MKFGFDFHGVIDKDPKVFGEIMRLLVCKGHEVHIITGTRKTDETIKWLIENNIDYTHFYSISDDLTEKGLLINEDEAGPWFKEQDWDTAKAYYCEEHKIDLHIDDSPEYEKYFSTPFMLMRHQDGDNS